MNREQRVKQLEDARQTILAKLEVAQSRANAPDAAPALPPVYAMQQTGATELVDAQAVREQAEQALSPYESVELLQQQLGQCDTLIADAQLEANDRPAEEILAQNKALLELGNELGKDAATATTAHVVHGDASHAQAWENAHTPGPEAAALPVALLFAAGSQKLVNVLDAVEPAAMLTEGMKMVADALGAALTGAMEVISPTEEMTQAAQDVVDKYAQKDEQQTERMQEIRAQYEEAHADDSPEQKQRDQAKFGGAEQLARQELAAQAKAELEFRLQLEQRTLTDL